MSQQGTTAEPADAASGMDAERMAEIAQMIASGATDLAAVAGMTDDELEAVYALGHGFYESGRFEDARDMFRFLCMHRHMETRFWFGLGAASQMLRDYDKAIIAYRTSAMLNLEDPQIPLRAAECFRALGDEENARAALDAVLILAERKPEHATFAKRATLMLAQMKAKEPVT